MFLTPAQSFVLSNISPLQEPLPPSASIIFQAFPVVPFPFCPTSQLGAGGNASTWLTTTEKLSVSIVFIT